MTELDCTEIRQVQLHMHAHGESASMIRTETADLLSSQAVVAHIGTIYAKTELRPRAACNNFSQIRSNQVGGWMPSGLVAVIALQGMEKGLKRK